MGRYSRNVGAIILVLIFLATVSGGYAQSSFYAGKKLTFIVSTNPGGSYDTYARLLAPFLTKYLRVSNIVVTNVPGAGHIKGVNDLYDATPDGLTIGISNVGGLVYAQLEGKAGVRFDLKKFIWLANPIVDPRVLVISGKEPYKDILELSKVNKQINVASSGVGTTSHTDPLFLNVIFGTHFKPIAGYTATTEALLAIERGECLGRIGTYSMYYTSLIQNKALRPILLVGERRPEVPTELQGVPWLVDIAPKGKATLVNLLNASSDLWGPIAATPGIPKDRAIALTVALEKALNDPAWAEAASKALILPKYDKPEKTAKMVIDALNQSPDTIDLVKRIVATK